MSLQERGSTGVPGLDVVLGGPRRQGALTLIVGPPGAGKTVLASQMIFHAASQGLPTLVFTMFSENLEQYLEHMREFAFFNAQLVGSLIQVFALPSLLNTSNENPATVITRTIRETGAQLVVIDGFQGIDTLLSESQSTRTLLATLATQMRYLNTSLVITVTGEARDQQQHAEFTTADVIISLMYRLEGRRHVRRLEIVKQRGRAQLPGLHTYVIDNNGVCIFPRIEVYTPPTSHEPHPRSDERLTFGLTELDALLNGGLNVGTTTLMAGAPGVGKTTLGLHWAVAQASPETSTVFLTFSEKPEQLIQKGQAFGLDIASAIASGALQVIHVLPIDIEPDYVAQLLLNIIANKPVQRLVIDNAIFMLAELGGRARDYMAALNAICYGHNISTLWLYEISPFEGLRLDASASSVIISDNTIVVQQYEIAGELRRLLAVLRMRFSTYDRTLRELVFEDGGIRVLTPQQSLSSVLKTGATMSGGVAPITNESIE